MYTLLSNNAIPVPIARCLGYLAAASGQSLRHQFSLVDYPIHTGLETGHRPWEPCSSDVDVDNWLDSHGLLGRKIKVVTVGWSL